MSTVARACFSLAITGAVTVALAAFATRAHADLAVLDNDRTIEIDCAQDPEVSLLGNHLTVITRGVCAKIVVAGNHDTVTGSSAEVYVAGNHNTVEMTSADEVTLAGNYNRISVRGPIKRKAPKIANLGRSNRVLPQER